MLMRASEYRDVSQSDEQVLTSVADLAGEGSSRSLIKDRKKRPTLTITAAARTLGVTRKAVIALIESRLLDYDIFGSQRRIPPEAIGRFIRDSTLARVHEVSSLQSHGDSAPPRRKRRPRGSGSIYPAKGFWFAAISLGVDGNRRRRQQSVCCRTEKEARFELKRLKGNVEGSPSDFLQLRFDRFLNHWLDDVVAPRVAPKTLESYSQIVRRNLSPFIGSLVVSQLRPIHVADLYRQLLKKGRSADATKRAGTILGNAIKHAVFCGYLSQNPVSVVQRPRVRRPEMRVWDSSQVGIFLKTVANTPLETLYVLAVATGMRQGELFGLEWHDIDVANKAIMVRRSVQESSNGERSAKECKGKHGRRIDVSQSVIDSLLQHRMQMSNEGRLECPMFCDSTGGYLRKSNFSRKSFWVLLKNSGLPKIRFHDLRHTHATLLLLAGENVKVVSERLGHSTIQITLDTYAHVVPSMQRAAADKFEEILVRAQTNDMSTSH